VLAEHGGRGIRRRFWVFIGIWLGGFLLLVLALVAGGGRRPLALLA